MIQGWWWGVRVRGGGMKFWISLPPSIPLSCVVPSDGFLCSTLNQYLVSTCVRSPCFSLIYPIPLRSVGRFWVSSFMLISRRQARALTSRGFNLLPDKSEAVSLWARAQYWAICWIVGTKVGIAGINRVHIQYTCVSISWVDFGWKIRSWLTSLTVAFVSGISDLHLLITQFFYPGLFKNWLSNFPHLFGEKSFFLGKKKQKIF